LKKPPRDFFGLRSRRKPKNLPGESLRRRTSMRSAWILATVMLAAFLCANGSAAEPTYLIVQPPGHMVTRHGGLGVYPGQGLGVNTHTYSYGWFGANPLGKWQRHYSATNSNRQWSWRN